MAAEIKMSPKLKAQYEMALEARKRAHQPYSKFSVGAALSFRNSDQIVSGCNIENASYGASICAERVSVLSARSQDPGIKLASVVIVTDMPEPASPCALCLQVFAEFCDDDFEVYLGNLDGLKKKYLFRELLPHAFRSFTPDGRKSK